MGYFLDRSLRASDHQVGKNMKIKLFTPLQDTYHLGKRVGIATIFDQLKNISQTRNPRHRPVVN